MNEDIEWLKKKILQLQDRQVELEEKLTRAILNLENQQTDLDHALVACEKITRNHDERITDLEIQAS